METTAFDADRTDAYAEEAKARWGDTAAYRDYERKTAGQSEADLQYAGDGLMAILAEFGKLKEKPASGPEAQEQVKALQTFISAHFYTCTDEILAGLGQLYAAGGDFTDRIDRAGGEGTARFAAEAIRLHCG